MAGIQLVSANGTVIGGREEARAPLQVVTMPNGGNAYRFAGFTGTLSAALAANSEVLQFRFVAGTKSFAVVEKVIFNGLGIITAATAAGALGFQLVPARTWTAAGSGGTRIAQTGDNLQLETASPNSQVVDLGIATTGALTAGTKTLDANAIGLAIGGVGTAALTAYAGTALINDQPLLDAQGDGAPLVLANQEGFVIRTTHAGPASLTYVAGFTICWREVTTY